MVAGPGRQDSVRHREQRRGPLELLDWATIAYSAATGARRWVKRHDGPVSSNDYASALALSPDGKTVYVTGNSWLADRENRTAPTEYVTIAYRTATGARLWARHYHNVAFWPGRRCLGGRQPGRHGVRHRIERLRLGNGDRDYATIAYRG